LAHEAQASDLSTKDLIKLIGMKKSHSSSDIRIDGKDSTYPVGNSATVEENWEASGTLLSAGALSPGMKRKL
jgi:hypothetical protein